MSRSLQWIFWILIFYVCAGCASTDERPGALSQQAQASSLPSTTQGVPVLELSETSHDFGQVSDTAGEVVHEFKLKNTGAGVLQIKKILPG